MFEKDIIKTSQGTLEITFIGHGTLMFLFNDKVIHVDPWSRLADYSALPKADIILITHDHMDHLDPGVLKILRKETTDIIIPEVCAEKIKGGIIMRNGDSRTIHGFDIKAVPAYNLVNMRNGGIPFHPKGIGNGYVITFEDKHVYIAGDTENIPEMNDLKNIDIAFLPMNLPYTMTPEMVADAVRTLKPTIAYPYHYGETDISVLTNLLENENGTEVRIRQMQ